MVGMWLCAALKAAGDKERAAREEAVAWVKTDIM